MEDYKWTWLLPLQALFFVPMLFGLVLVVMESYCFVLRLSYEKHNLKVDKVHLKKRYKGGEFLAGSGVTIKDSIHTSVSLESLIRMKICHNKEEIEKFLIKKDSILPIWTTPSGELPALRIGKTRKFSFWIKKCIRTWLLLLILSIPVYIVHLLDKRVQERYQRSLMTMKNTEKG